MSQRCPVCGTRLWSEPLLVRSKMHCPRCGAEFKPTVPWHYLRLLLVLLIVLGLGLAFALDPSDRPLLLFVGFLILFSWFASRLIHFEPIGPELTPSEGTLDPERWKMRVEDRNREDLLAEENERWRFRRAFQGALMLILLLILLACLYRFV